MPDRDLTVPTIHGTHTLDDDDHKFIDYLDDTVDELPGGHSLGMLLLKGDPTAYYVAKSEWLAEREPDETED